MYRGGSVGKVNGLHPTYRYLDRMFRKTIDCKGGDKGTIADYSRNQMLTPSVSLTLSGVRSRVLVRGPSRVVVLIHTSCK